MDQVAEIRNKTDIVSLIQGFITLKKAGQNFKANCPFHGEKTPSFVVSPERQIWHCFGCGKGGDAYSFLMEYEHMEFPEALRILADKAGVQLIQKGFDATTASQKEIIYRLNAIACEFYHFLLTKHAVGKNALQYLTEERHIKPQTINTYMLGFAPRSDTALVSYLMKKKQYKAQDILEAGLATKRYSGIVDFFQGRVMFPLYDHRGNVIGFSGRVLTDSQSSKYINTRETLVYHKGSVFFGLNSSKEAIKKEKKAIIMEGELDVIAVFQEGITNTVAIKGTALTEEQVNLIARFASTVALCLDQDNAGQEAMKRSLVILERKGLTTTAITIPNGKDPDEAIQSDPILFKKAVHHDVPVYDVLLELALKNYNPQTAQGKKQIGDEFLQYISPITNEIMKEHYIRLLSKTIDISYEVLVREMDRLQKKEIIKQEVPFTKNQRPREEMMEEYLVGLVVQHGRPQALLQDMQDFLAAYQWIVPAYQKILHRIRSFVKKDEAFSSTAFLQSLPQELVITFDTCFLLPLPVLQNDEYYQREVKKIAEELYILGLRRQIKVLSQQIRQHEDDEEQGTINTLQQELSALSRSLAHKEKK